jgi:hypothetical protein
MKKTHDTNGLCLRRHTLRMGWQLCRGTGGNFAVEYALRVHLGKQKANHGDPERSLFWGGRRKGVVPKTHKKITFSYLSSILLDFNGRPRLYL